MTSYLSTRGGEKSQSFTDVLLEGLASDGGLYVPEIWPQLDSDRLRQLRGQSYSDIAYEVTAPFVGDAIDAKQH